MKNFVMILVVLTGCSGASFAVPGSETGNDSGNDVNDTVKTTLTSVTVPDTNSTDTNPQDSGATEAGNDTNVSVDSGTDSGVAETALAITCDAMTQMTTSIRENEQNIIGTGTAIFTAQYSVCENAVLYTGLNNQTAPCAFQEIQKICSNSNLLSDATSSTDQNAEMEKCINGLTTAIYQITATAATFINSSNPVNGKQMVCEMYLNIRDPRYSSTDLSNCISNMLLPASAFASVGGYCPT